MKRITSTASIVRTARERAGLSQRELADRAGVAQPLVARLEGPGANPTLRTLEKLAAAAGFTLRVILEPVAPLDPVVERYKRDVDRTLLRENLKRTVDERIRSLGEWQEATAALQAATRRAKAKR
jgi:transcriptional regulator with XRE-family HTH domain